MTDSSLVAGDPRHPASFRDPAGFIFERDGVLYRRIHESFKQDYDRLIESGLYASLVTDGLLVPHEEVLDESIASGSYKVIKPLRVETLSYPYEWCFSQLKSAAIATLQIQLRALSVGMTLKDATAYNIQFVRHQATLIDTVSLAVRRDEGPWAAYSQFCRHFLAPLALMAHRDLRLGMLGRIWNDGVPLDLASRLLPWRTWFRSGLLIHLHLHAQSERRLSGRRDLLQNRKRIPLPRLIALLDHLRQSIERLTHSNAGSRWSGYAPEGHYHATALDEKRAHVRQMIDRTAPRTVWDFGSNRGDFARLAAAGGAAVMAFDSDPLVVDRAFKSLAADGVQRVLPLVMDLANPSPASGWAHAEQRSLTDRGPVDLILMLAVVHHLVIVNGVHFEQIADWCARSCRYLVIEYVDREDQQVHDMLLGRPAGAAAYDRNSFLSAFERVFRLLDQKPLAGGTRVLYLFEVQGDRRS